MTTLKEMLIARAEATPDRIAFRFAAKTAGADREMSYGELLRAASNLAQGWLERCPGASRAVISTPPGRDFVVALFGCFLADIVAVPTYPPTRGESVARFRAIQRDCRPDFIVTTSDLEAVIRAAALAEEGISMAIVKVDTVASGGGQLPQRAAAELALLQYTSGSTGEPKGVMLSHANLLSNLACIARNFGHSAESRGLIWLPPYHDMGLIGGILQPVYSGFPVTLMTPQQFLLQPLHWLKRISDERATTSGGPNLAYELCVQKISPEERAQLDLSSWSVCFSGSEPVRAETIERFSSAFAACGFSPRAFFPCYGLAEATLMVAGSGLGNGPRVIAADQKALNDGRLTPVADGTKTTRSLVSCGAVADEFDVRIVDPESRRQLAGGEIGEVWVRGPGVAVGYWNKPEATTATFAARMAGDDSRAYLRTGDLGAVHANELFITGRRKEIVVVGGRKLHPQDIEDSVSAAIDVLAARKTVVFSNGDENVPGLVALQEFPIELREQANEIGEQMRQHVAAEFGVDLVEVRFVRRSAIPTTLTGKTQRLEAAARYRAETIPAIAVWRRRAAAAVGGVAADAASPQYAIEQLLGRPLGAEDLDRTLIDLGFDSLRMAELAAIWVRACHREIPVEFDRCPVRDLIATREASDAQPATPTAPSSGEQPLSERQKSIWYAETAGIGDAYILARIFKVSGGLSADAVRNALVALLERHPILRSRVVEGPDGIVQRLVVDLPLDFAVHAGESRGLRAWIERLQKDARQPFDLRCAAPWRVRLVRLTAQRHLLLFAVHHLVCDYTSLETLHQEFWTLCTGIGNLPPKPREFLDFVAQERSDAARWPASVAFWRSMLDGSSTPADFPRRPTASKHTRGRFEQQAIELCADDLGALDRLCRAEGCTPYVGLVATLQILLAIYNDRDDVAIGTTQSVRPPAFAGTIGYFVNPVVLPLRIDRAATFLDALRAAAGITRAARAHAHVPYIQLVEQLNPDRTSSEAGFFSVLFNYLSSASPGEEGGLLGADTFTRGELSVQTEAILPATPQFPLVLQVLRSKRGATAVVDYDSGFYDAATIRGVVANWIQLIASCASTPTARLRDVKALSPWEAKCLRRFNRQASPTPAIANVFARFEEARRRNPEKIAVRCPARSLTYREFGARVDRIAGALRQRGIAGGAIVAIALERSTDLVAVLWGTLKAGGAVLAIDPSLPLERIAYMLQQLPVRLQVGPIALGRASEHDVVSVEELMSAVDVAPLTDWSHRPGDPAYVIFTSGSTGRPKAVANTHASLANVLGATDLGFTPDEVFAQYTSVSFDISIWELLLPPLLGATMVVVPAVDSLDPGRLVRAVSGFGITAMQFVPTILRLFLKECSSTTAPLRLRRVVCGGEKLDVRLKDRFFEVLGSTVRLWHLYGPAEAAIFVTQQEIRPEHKTIAIGRPIPNAKLFVLGRELEPLPIGAIGEICIGGIAIAKGYLDNSALTTERFRSAGPGIGRIYRTGDLGRWLPSGEIEYTGRVDHQVKIRGVRIELEEIERVLLEVPNLRAAAVLLQANETGEPALYAYVQSEPGTSPSELRRLLRQRLVDAMVPQRFLAVAKMPLTPGGKIDRQRLATTPSEPLRDVLAAEASDDPIVRDLRAVFAEVLRHSDINIHEHFFALGGHSLQLVQLAQLIQQRLGVTLQLTDVISRPSIVELAKLVRERSASRDTAVEPDEIVGVL